LFTACGAGLLASSCALTFWICAACFLSCAVRTLICFCCSSLRDKEGKPYTVRYDAVNAMLLNEFLKEHRKNEEQQAIIMQLKFTDAKQETIIAQQQKQIEALTAGLQKVSAQLELNKASPQTVLNNQ
jgi:hypothetical protein